MTKNDMELIERIVKDCEEVKAEAGSAYAKEVAEKYAYRHIKEIILGEKGVKA